MSQAVMNIKIWHTVELMIANACVRPIKGAYVGLLPILPLPAGLQHCNPFLVS